MKKGIYILPSLFTIANLAAGFRSILFSIEGKYNYAAIAIFFAIVFDILDGRIARLTKTTSRFGMELDSLADIISFGLAPAIMMYNMILFKYSTWGLIISFLFLLSGMLRLARYNTEKEIEETTSFEGFPIPAAAAILASFVIAMPSLIGKIPFIYKMLPLVIILLSYLMLSKIKYNSFKYIKLNRRKPMRFLILIIIAIVLILRYPANMILIIFSLYLLTGLIELFRRLFRLSSVFRKTKNG